MAKRKHPTPLGEKRNRLTCLAEGVAYADQRRLVVHCECGRSTTIQLSNFGVQKTCGKCNRGYNSSYNGVYNKKHPMYRTWCNKKRVTNNTNCRDYAKYGGRGITLWDNWRNDFPTFAKYLESLPGYGTPGLTLDRIDNDGNYEPGNLRWATVSEQQFNRRKLRDCTSKHKGVFFHKANGTWVAQSFGIKPQKHIGSFKTEEEAHQAVQAFLVKTNLRC